MAYNTSFTRRKSTRLHDLDCRTTGAVKYAGRPPYTATFIADEIIEAGECVSMLRIPKNFTVTSGQLSWSPSGTDAVVGVGDPFCCGRFLGPIPTRVSSGNETVAPSGFSCGTASLAFIMKVGRVGDGCGIGYTFTCETDVILTNGYGENSFGIGGGKTGSANGGLNAGTLPVGWTCFLRLDGYQNTDTANTT
jgi:hypothetical protein